MENFVDQIADALQEFGQYNGLNLDYQYYHDLAWGGLRDTRYFKNLNAEQKQIIKDRLSTELTGYDMNDNYQNQEGSSAGC